MGYARRWLMKGPWKHPNGVWYYRGELPKDIWDARERIRLAGVPMPRGKEVRRSLEATSAGLPPRVRGCQLSSATGGWSSRRL